MAALHEVLASRRDEVMSRWKVVVQGTITPESMPALELLDHLPGFLDEVIAALRTDAGVPTTVPRPEDSPTAAGHGEQRLRLGFSLDAVVREYGALRDAIIATGREAGAHVTVREAQSVFDSTISGIAFAVSEYARQRDAELQRQHNEHIAFIAHELRNPLGTAMSAFELLTRKGHIPAESRAGGALGRGLQQMHELIDHALDVSRAASGIELRRENTRISVLVSEAELAAANEAEDKDITIQVNVRDDARVYVDRRLIRSALGNLVRNAVKYSKARGTVELRARVVGERAVVEIEDSCGGLPNGMVEKAFAPFVRLTSDEPGFGLGLAIAKQAVDAHAGLIRIQNLPNKGCIFVLELPIAPT